MITADVIAFSAVPNRAQKNSFEWPVVIAGIAFRGLFVGRFTQRNEVEYSRCEVGDLPIRVLRHITHHGKRLKVDLRAHDGGPIVEQHAAFEI